MMYGEEMEVSGDESSSSGDLDRDEQEQLITEVRGIRQNTVSKKSRNAYQRSTVRFLSWLYHNKRSLLTQEFLDLFRNEFNSPEARRKGPQRQFIKAFLNRDSREHPIKFQELTAEQFMVWIVSLRKSNGQRPKYSAFNTHRSALFNLYRDYGLRMSKQLEGEIANHFKGLKRTIAAEIQNGNGVIKEGKDELQFSMYKFLALMMLKHSGDNKEFIFAHCFMILCWNLMCRSSNVIKVCFAHMEWRDDALCIYFNQTKSDQEGEKPKNPRHVYANPITPAVCPILSIALYMLCFPILSRNQRKLFPGVEQYDHYRKAFQKLLQFNEVEAELVRSGVKADDLGTHSKRKGSGTYASSGSTACPSSVAIHIRMDWSMGNVPDRYLRYEAAGDQHVGRTVSGLPPNSYMFSILPPFIEQPIPNMIEIITACFPNIPPNCYKFAEFCLASVAYHEQFLRDTLSSDHTLFNSPFFTMGWINIVKPSVVCRVPNPDDVMQATGVPPHVILLNEMNHVSENLSQVSDRVVQGVIEVLEERAIGAGTVTRDGLHDMIGECLSEFGLTTLVAELRSQRVDNGLVTNNENSQQLNDESRQRQMFMWGGRFRHIPEDFSFPKTGIYYAWQQWLLGNREKQYPPLRILRSSDMKDRNMQKKLGEFKFLMKAIEDDVRGRDQWIENPTIEQANQMLISACEANHDIFPGSSPENRKRRLSQLQWTTLAKDLRKTKRQMTQINSVLAE